MCKARHQISVVAAQAEERSQLTTGAGERPLLDAIQFVLLRLNTRDADSIAKVVNAFSKQCTLRWFALEVRIDQQREHFVERRRQLFCCLREHKHIVNVE